MKRSAALLFTLLLLFSFCACKAADAPATFPAPVETSAVTGEEISAGNPSKPTGSGTAAEYDKIDVDLTQLSSTMVYSEVYNMMSRPNDYVGKVVKMSGGFSYYYDQSAGAYYFACLISDATACCSQGMEFVRKGEFTYPDGLYNQGDYDAFAEVIDTSLAKAEMISFGGEERDVATAALAHGNSFTVFGDIDTVTGTNVTSEYFVKGYTFNG